MKRLTKASELGEYLSGSSQITNPAFNYAINDQPYHVNATSTSFQTNSELEKCYTEYEKLYNQYKKINDCASATKIQPKMPEELRDAFKMQPGLGKINRPITAPCGILKKTLENIDVGNLSNIINEEADVVHETTSPMTKIAESIVENEKEIKVVIHDDELPKIEKETTKKDAKNKKSDAKSKNKIKKGKK